MDSFNWLVFYHLLFSTAFIRPLGITLFATIASMALGSLLGLLGAIGSLSANSLLRGITRAYTWLFRGIPTLVQIVFWYDALPELTHGLINLPPLWAGILALGVNEGAYMTEIIRAGFLSVEEGQHEAAKAVGMPARMILFTITIPQAMRFIIPPAGNQIINMLKNTSLLFAIAVPEIFATGMNIYSENFRYFEVIATMSILYLFLSSVITVLVKLIENVFSIDYAINRSAKRAIIGL